MGIPIPSSTCAFAELRLTQATEFPPEHSSQRQLPYLHSLIAKKCYCTGTRWGFPKGFSQICANTNQLALCNSTFQIASVVALKKPFFYRFSWF